jgi:hypothetical protein
MPVGGNMRLGFGRKVDKRTGEKTTLIPFSFNFSTISSSSIKAGMYMNDTTVLLEKTKEQS